MNWWRAVVYVAVLFALAFAIDLFMVWMALR